MKSSHSRAALTICYPLVLLMLQTLIGLPSVQSNTLLMATIEVVSPYHEMVVTLNCEDGPEGFSPCFYNRVGDEVRNVTVLGGDPKEKQYAVELNTTTEGYYFCRVGNQQSNEVLLVAYPFSDSSISRSYTVGLGAPVRMSCTVPFGVLREQYFVRWFKGLIEIIPDNFRIHFGADGALEFSEVEVADASGGYYCVVNVTRRDGVVVRQGSTIELNVMATLEMSRTLNDVSVEVNTEASFTCRANGVPAPRFTWLLNGTEHTAGITSTNTSLTSTVAVESTLILPAVTERNTGAVTCVAYHERNGQAVVVASTANLIVLTNDFTVVLSLQDGEVRVRGTLPVAIPGLFSLRVRFTSNEAVSREENTYLWDPSLVDTREIDVMIPREKLPFFKHFSVVVAIRRGNVNGPFTEPSNYLKDDFVPSDVGGSSNTVVAVIAVLVVLMLVGLVVLVAGCVLIYNKKGTTAYKTSSEYSNSEGGSLPRSVSRSSYGSERSHGSDRSDRSYSSRRSSRSSHSRYSSQSEVTSNKAEFALEKVQEEPQDIRDYETIDHKILKQWEQHKAHLDQNQPRGNFEDVQPVRRERDLEVRREREPEVRREREPEVRRAREPEVRRGRGPEPIFPHTHLGVPNALALPRQTFKDSNSSFEDLEEECLELSMEMPKSC